MTSRLPQHAAKADKKQPRTGLIRDGQMATSELQTLNERVARNKALTHKRTKRLVAKLPRLMTDEGKHGRNRNELSRARRVTSREQSLQDETPSPETQLELFSQFRASDRLFSTSDRFRTGHRQSNPVDQHLKHVVVDRHR